MHGEPSYKRQASFTSALVATGEGGASFHLTFHAPRRGGGLIASRCPGTLFSEEISVFFFYRRCNLRS